MAKLNDDVRRIRGIGDKRAQALNRLGISTIFDLISCFPCRYDDRSRVLPIAQTRPGEAACISAVIADEPQLQRIRRGLELVKFRAADETGIIQITYFNQPYIRQQLHRGACCRFYGKVEQRGASRYLTNPVFEPEGTVSASSVTGRIVPVYRLTAGLSQKTVLQSIRQGLDSVRVEEFLPEACQSRFPVPQEAYEQIHFPQSWESLEQARRRFVFEELFLLCCALGRKRREGKDGIWIPAVDFSEFFLSLPFTPTAAQRRAVEEASRDLSSGKQMNRLLQGDVGSGKTLVAAALIWQCARAGLVSAFMAPTEILAEQHDQTLSSFLSPFGIRTALLTGSVKASRKAEIRDALQNHELDLVIGTHALLGLEIPDLALTVTDEQHRFGVEQRAALGHSAQGPSPHVYVMSATPIPRSLALIIYGDLDVSVLDELPPGREKVDTFCVTSAYHERLLAFIRRLCGEGRQIFVVCPKVESVSQEEDVETAAEVDCDEELKSAVAYAEMLRAELPGLKIACLHGRMKPAEKDAVMRRMIVGELNVLVSTTVIEVGVDIPNAALMLIENAERFGLSQLHQLRGRVGRGRHKSYCVLVTDHDTPETKARMKVLCETEDGFRIAEEDLRLRGPGDFFGSRQHGLPALHIADLGTDADTLAEARQAADRLLSEDPELTAHPAIRERVELLLSRTEGTLN